MLSHQSRIRNKLEVSVFLLLILPSMLLSYFGRQSPQLSFTMLTVSTILRDLGLLLLILYFLWHNNETFQSIGLTSRHCEDDMVIGGILFFPTYFLALILQQIFFRYGYTVPDKNIEIFTGSKSIFELILAVILTIVVAVTEETLFRGYLLKRFDEILHNKIGALFIATTIFALGHGYEGLVGITIVGLIGLIYGIVYLWRGSLVAPITMHLLHNSIGLVFSQLQ